MFPNYALLVLVLALGVSAVVWTVGARLRARRGGTPLPGFRSMMGRGLLVPTAMILIAADFAQTPKAWVAWIGLVFGSWLVTLAVVRGVNRAVGFRPPAPQPVATKNVPTPSEELASESVA